MSEPQAPTPPPAALSPADQVNNAADRDAKNGQMVEVFGTYTEVAGGKDEGVMTGHAAVTLADGSAIHLAPPWHPEAIRSAEERAKLAGKPVVAKGLLFAECPPPSDGSAYRKVPCLYLGLSVMDRGTYDFMHGSDF